MSGQVAADLRAAAEVLRRDGWTQRQYRERRWYAPWRCRYCPSGAVMRVVQPRAEFVSDLTWVERRRLYEALWAVDALVDDYGVEKWNDRPGRTADEVIAALEAAADAAEAQAQPQSGDRP